MRKSEDSLVWYLDFWIFTATALGTMDSIPAEIQGNEEYTDENEKKVIEYNDTGWRYPTQVWKFQRDCLTSNLHPTQKPLLLCETLVKTFSNEGDIVLDNCMGSGTVGVACKLLNRKFIGIELEENYFKIAKERINHN